MDKLKLPPAAIAGIALVLVLAIAWFFRPQPTMAPAPQGGEETATTTEEGGVAVPGDTGSAGLPVEPTFTLPAGAVAIDDYAYTLNNKVFFRSLTSPTPLEIMDADGAKFDDVSAFVRFPGSAIMNDCGAAGQYKFYTDDTRTYFYQVWRAPEFRSSSIEVIVGADAETFVVSDTVTARDKDRIYKVNYTVGTTTCAYVLTKGN